MGGPNPGSFSEHASVYRDMLPLIRPVRCARVGSQSREIEKESQCMPSGGANSHIGRCLPCSSHAGRACSSDFCLAPSGGRVHPGCGPNWGLRSHAILVAPVRTPASAMCFRSRAAQRLPHWRDASPIHASRRGPQVQRPAPIRKESGRAMMAYSARLPVTTYSMYVCM